QQHVAVVREFADQDGGLAGRGQLGTSGLPELTAHLAERTAAFLAAGEHTGGGPDTGRSDTRRSDTDGEHDGEADE
ncbi:hypothetical protein, partial [Kitasatospora sp. NPDC007106]|uniref:hypothetical protein n=1 Tax=Kitasatospora sp. NPDC007106 TaxID=3156914 RepID=UPI0033DE076E